MLDLSYLDKRIKKLEDIKKEVFNTLSTIGIQLEKKEKLHQNLLHNFKLDIKHLKELRIACVMDRFTLDSYSPECNLLELTPDGWKGEIDKFSPHLIFIESAWQGKDNLWYRKIANGSKEYFEMTSYCQEKNIPIIFWNKEDPVYTDTFMIAARMADFVFTTDIDCIKKYKNILKHDNVYHLHFAAQPQIHNPIEKYERKDKYCFAGAYYHKYVKRCKVFDDFANFFIETKGLDIYDRNYKKALPEHAFPEKYEKYILGKLDSSEIDRAYKGYNFGINMNSVDQSQTMFARRVFEMLASNTVTVGNYSRGVKNLFGDLTICTDDSETLKQNVTTWCKDEQTFRKYRLLGLRKVLSEHLYEDRLSYIVEKIFNKNIKKEQPFINVFCEATTSEEIAYAIASFEKQTYLRKKLYLITEDEVNTSSPMITCLKLEQVKQKVSKLVGEEEYIAVFNVNNYYGKNYLLDLALNTRYSNFNGVGKASFYENVEDKLNVKGNNTTYKKVNSLVLDQAIAKSSLFTDDTLQSILASRVLQDEKLISVDEFNFCKGLVAHDCIEVDDLKLSDQGIAMQRIQKAAEGIKTSQFIGEGITIEAGELFSCIKQKSKEPITITQTGNKLVLVSRLEEDKNYYINIEKWHNVKDFIEGKYINFIFNGIGSLDNLGTCIFYDKDKNKLSATFTKFNRLFSAEVPESATYFKLNFRIKGSGEFKIDEIIIGSNKIPDEKACFLSRSNVLVLSNQYPSQEELYRNMFVHKRMMAYKEEGFIYDVMKMNIYAKNEYREFEGINVVEGQGEVLANILETGTIDTVCVHFLDRPMWEVLKTFKDKLRIIIWSHGADIQPWWRREYLYQTKEDLEKAKKDSDMRMNLWKEVFDSLEEYNLHFVFVSKHSMNMVLEDYKMNLSVDKYSIIHNCIDTNMFNYINKDIEQRKRILSIRPYATRTYANDLTVKAILHLSNKECFEDMEFRIIGNGELFDETVKPLRKFKNVFIEKKFLRQDEIADLHKAYGVFVAPTRMDTQGVSRDEAMSSGLVPITSAVAAIPEFVDSQCGILVAEEEYIGIADGMEKLYNEPEYFLQLSRNAAERVRKQSSKVFTIQKEIELIN
ncbi:methyltransferase type 12 [Sporanaerobium hydrogeniformans]|uniref:Methyltransferase type 12 n=1 Tax=Sporanaerobium hydrogeniformans TaxID=3072179 RepID=A0AC61DBP9_9FIRM|nr:glycosyltransferase [Sporanaerobium hydrogeniformans]PHV70166.1 methyltransferase type 12 [Sporanaerobium hydrogeniformans]